MLAGCSKAPSLRSMTSRKSRRKSRQQARQVASKKKAKTANSNQRRAHHHEYRNEQAAKARRRGAVAAAADEQRRRRGTKPTERISRHDHIDANLQRAKDNADRESEILERLQFTLANSLDQRFQLFARKMFDLLRDHLVHA